MQTVHDTDRAVGNASFRSRIEVTDQFAKAFFSTRAWNDILRAGLHAGGEKWRVSYLPLRFTFYADAVLGYKAKFSRFPVKSGRLQAEALANSTTEARVTSKNAVLLLHISVPVMLDNKGQSVGRNYSAVPVISDLLRTITSREVGVIADACEATMLALISGATPSVSRKGTVRGTLSPTQRQSISHTKRTKLATTRRAA